MIQFCFSYIEIEIYLVKWFEKFILLESFRDRQFRWLEKNDVLVEVEKKNNNNKENKLKGKGQENVMG